MIATQINTDFDKVEKRDLFIFISKLEQLDKSDWLKHDYKVALITPPPVNAKKY